MGLAGAIGGVVGGLLGKKSGGGTTTVQQSADPWVGAQPGLAALYGGATANYINSLPGGGGGPQYYPGQTVASPSQDTLNGLNFMTAVANQGNPALQAGINNAGTTAGGGYLWSNPAIAGLQSGSNYDVTGSQGWGDLMSMGRGLGDFKGMDTLGQFAGGDFINSTLGLGGLQNLGEGDALGSTTGLAELLGIGRGSMLGTTPGMSVLGGIAGGQNIGQMPGQATLDSIASGSMLNKNPYVDSMFDQAAGNVGRQYSKNIMPGIASMFAGAGRYGSDAMNNGLEMGQRAYGDQMDNLATQIYGGNYANERNLQQQALGMQQQGRTSDIAQQLQALGLLGNLGQNEQSMRIGALNSAGGLSSQEQSRMLQALQSEGQLSQNERQMQLGGAQAMGSLDAQNRGQRLGALQTGIQSQLQGQSLRNQALQSLSQQFMNERNNMMQASSMAPALEQARFMAPQALLGVGQQRDAYNQNVLNSDINRWDFNQNAQRNNLSFLSSIMSGASPYKQSSSTQSGTGNPMMNAMGGAMMAGGLFGANGAFPNAFSGLGSMFGGGGMTQAIAPSAFDFGSTVMDSALPFLGAGF